ncbi:MAG: tRNA lysidine(34) synthetase TilS [Gemmatimonadetes bacterium]|nr:tRNA lysidine(34) synthetase TilS [Gemmatimonadota bacterium]
MSDSVAHKVEAAVLRHRMIGEGDHVIAAVSGGVDSVVLLHVLHVLCGRFSMKLGAAHLDHGLRGQEGREDAAFVMDYAASLGLPCVVERADVAAYCRKARCPIEQGAREVRYGFLRRVLLDQRADSVATGHTADDQAETVLMRLLRGSGSSGLSAIRPVRDGWIIRPLLDVTADEIAAYARSHGLSFRVDRTNAVRDMLRNRIRHHLVPLLQREYNPQIVQGLGRLADVIRGEAEYLDKEVSTFLAGHSRFADGRILHLDLAAWPNAAPAVQRVLIRHLVRTLGGNAERLSYDQVEDTRAWIGRGAIGRIHGLPGGIRMECRRAELVACRGSFTPFRLVFEVPGQVEVPDTDLSIRIAEGSVADAPAATPRRAVFDAEAVPRYWTVRSREPGDRMSPYGLAGHKSLKKLFNEWDVPRLLRDRVPVVTDGDRVLWVAGHRQSNEGMVTGKTRRVMVAELMAKDSS